MVSRLFGAKPLNLCWVIVIWTLSKKLHWNFNQNIKLSIHENASEIIVCGMAAILSRGRWINSLRPGGAYLPHCTGFSLVQEMACPCSVPSTVLEPVLTYCQLVSYMLQWTNYLNQSTEIFHWKIHSKMQFAKVSDILPGLNVLIEFNSLTPGRYDCTLKSVIFKCVSVIDILSIFLWTSPSLWFSNVSPWLIFWAFFCERPLEWMP